MIIIDRWNTQLADRLNDPLLAPQRLQDLRMNGMLLMAREEREVLGAVCLLPFGEDIGIVHGLWIGDSDPNEQRAIAQPLVDQILTNASTLRRTALIPQTVLPYVNQRVLTRKKPDMDLRHMQRLMDAAGVPKKHKIRNTTYDAVVCMTSRTEL